MFDVSEAVRTARAWMRRRVEAGEPALSGMVTRAEVTYAWPREDGTVGSDREPVALFTGEAVHAYLGHLPDVAIEAMLDELAAELGAAPGRSASMSHSPAGPGSWTRASTPAGRERRAHTPALNAVGRVLPSASTAGCPQRAKANLKGRKRATFD